MSRILLQRKELVRASDSLTPKQSGQYDKLVCCFLLQDRFNTARGVFATSSNSRRSRLATTREVCWTFQWSSEPTWQVEERSWRKTLNLGRKRTVLFLPAIPFLLQAWLLETLEPSWDAPVWRMSGSWYLCHRTLFDSWLPSFEKHGP